MSANVTAELGGGVISLSVFDTVIVLDDIHTFCWGGVFSDEDISEIIELGQVIRGIRTRLVAEGKMPDNIVTRQAP